MGWRVGGAVVRGGGMGGGRRPGEGVSDELGCEGGQQRGLRKGCDRGQMSWSARSSVWGSGWSCV